MASRLQNYTLFKEFKITNWGKSVNGSNYTKRRVMEMAVSSQKNTAEGTAGFNNQH